MGCGCDGWVPKGRAPQPADPHLRPQEALQDSHALPLLQCRPGQQSVLTQAKCCDELMVYTNDVVINLFVN